MGGPMGPPPGPPQKKSSLPLILGIGCGGLLLLGIIGFVVFAFVIKKAADEAVAEIEASTSAGPTGGGVTAPVGAAGTGELKAELRDLRDYKADFGKGRNFISEVHNTGTETIGLMTVKLTVFDASNTALDSASCYNPMRSLEPGDKFPCQFRLTKVSSWASYKTEIESMKNFLKSEPATLEISEAKLKPKRGYDPITVDGKIKNNSAFKAKSVMVIVSLYDAGGKIVGSDTALVAGNDIDAGAGATFAAKVWSVAAPPETFRVRAVGYKQ